MKKITLLFLFLPVILFAQGEANNWYFGQFAGIRFESDGTVTPLGGSGLSTNEGCSTISDSDGNLLFYTDGRNVWDRNHIKMPNGDYNAGTGLLGDPSSTQSAIIVPKKDNPDIYYIFTVDEPHHQNTETYPDQYTGNYTEPNGIFFIPDADDGFNNGLNYSIVDLSVTGDNGSIGDVTTRNVHLVTYDADNDEEAKYKCSEKITAVKNSTGTGFWVVSQFLDKFYSFFVDETGVEENPVISTATPVISQAGYRRNAIGYLKASPDGSKLAIAHQQRSTTIGGATENGAVYLYDFNDATGEVTNAVAIRQQGNPYGIEFSAQSKKLYVAYSPNSVEGGTLRQYNLLSDNIAASELTVSDIFQPGALQLGPNGKIYFTNSGSQFLDVINEPEEDGILCNFQPSTQSVSVNGSGVCTLGLPPFITSLFSATIEAGNTCLGEATQFNLNVNNTFDSVVWDFGDGAPTSSDENPIHTYTAIGSYNVVANITRQGETSAVSRQITIHAVPIANTPAGLTECDPDNDGFAVFNLTGATASVLGNQSSAAFEVRYFASHEDADANTPALSNTAHTNASNPQIIFARIQNKANASCYAITSFPINVSNTPTLNGNSFEICDDNIDGDDTNGQAIFDLDAVTAALVQNPAQFTTIYYATQGNAQSQTAPLPQQFYNTVPTSQTVFARVVNNASAVCFGILPVILVVNPLPSAVPNAALVQCDLGIVPDGFTQFNLNEADTMMTGGLPDRQTAYYATTNNAETDIGEITTGFINSANPQVIAVKVTNTLTGCYRIMPLELVVNTATIPPVSIERCDDDGVEDGIAEFDLSILGLENGIDSVTYYAFEEDALLEQNATGSLYTNTTAYQQSVYARIENNNNCTAIQEILLIVHRLPDIDTEDEAVVCINTGDFIELDAGENGSMAGLTYHWSNGSTRPAILINQPGTYSVTVTNIHGCDRIRTITVVPSDVALINDIDIKDLRDNNTVTVYASPTGNVNTTYLYSLNAPDGPYQESNFFENVPPGVHTIYVYDVSGCGVVSKEIAVLAIPNFFSPNGDGINDYWRIKGMSGGFYANSTIRIFDRYGKLLADINPQSPGWDGNYNGARLPSTDYWYVITLDTGRTVRGHFSMIR